MPNGGACFIIRAKHSTLHGPKSQRVEIFEPWFLECGAEFSMSEDRQTIMVAWCLKCGTNYKTARVYQAPTSYNEDCALLNVAPCFAYKLPHLWATCKKSFGSVRQLRAADLAIAEPEIWAPRGRALGPLSQGQPQFCFFLLAQNAFCLDQYLKKPPTCR